MNDQSADLMSSFVYTDSGLTALETMMMGASSSSSTLTITGSLSGMLSRIFT